MLPGGTFGGLGGESPRSAGVRTAAPATAAAGRAGGAFYRRSWELGACAPGLREPAWPVPSMQPWLQQFAVLTARIMATRGTYTDKAIEHEDVLDPTHEEHKQYFANLAKEAATAIVQPRRDLPEANLKPWTELIGNQLTFAIIGGNEQGQRRHLCQISRSSMHRWLTLMRNTRSKKVVSGGRDASGAQIPKFRANPEPTRRETISLSSWATELLNVHATRTDLRSFVHFLTKKCEELTGWYCFFGNIHGDTRNFHVNLGVTNRDRYGRKLRSVKVGVHRITPGTLIELRYEKEGFPVYEEATSEMRERLELGKKKKSWSGYWDLDLGIAADEWIYRWAEGRGLLPELLERRQRFANARLRARSVLKRVAADYEKELTAAYQTNVAPATHPQQVQVAVDLKHENRQLRKLVDQLQLKVVQQEKTITAQKSRIEGIVRNAVKGRSHGH